MKYICTKDEYDKKEVFVFPDSVNHDAMAEVLGCIKSQTSCPWKRVMREPVSAGFVTEDGKCHGESISLRLRARHEEDTALLGLQY